MNKEVIDTVFEYDGPKTSKPKQKQKSKTAEESFAEKAKLHIDKDIVYKAEKILEEVRIITVKTEDDYIQFLQDEVTLNYKPINDKVLNERMTKILERQGYFLKTEQQNDCRKVMRAKAYSNMIMYDDIKNNILLNNGILKISNEAIEFIPIEEDRLKYAVALIRMDVDYYPEAYKNKNEVVEGFFKSIMNDDEASVEFLLHALATPFMPRSKYEKAFVFFGDGSNGKSVLSELMKRVYAKRNITGVELAEMKDWNLAIMDNGIINWVQDFEKFDSWPNFKKIVSGETITVNQKFQDPVEKELTTQIFINANKLPSLGVNRDGGYTRRLEFIPFNRIFKGEERDTNILQKLTTKENIEWIFSKLISIVIELADDYSGSWFENNRPEPVKKLALKQSVEDSSALSFESWIVDNVKVVGKDISISSPDFPIYELENDSVIGENNNHLGRILYRGKLYKVYTIYCKLEGMKPMSKLNFENQISTTSLKLDIENRVAKSKGYYIMETKND